MLIVYSFTANSVNIKSVDDFCQKSCHVLDTCIVFSSKV